MENNQEFKWKKCPNGFVHSKRKENIKNTSNIRNRMYKFLKALMNGPKHILQYNNPYCQKIHFLKTIDPFKSQWISETCLGTNYYINDPNDLHFTT